jgi:hypothetical protein
MPLNRAACPAFLFLLASAAFAAEGVPALRLPGGVQVAAVRAASGAWGIAVTGAGAASVAQQRPIQLEFDGAAPASAAYDSVAAIPGGFIGRGKVEGMGAIFRVEDRWTASGGVLRVARTVTVSGSAKGGFLSAVTLDTGKPFVRSEVDFFAPGMMYGSTAGLTVSAIGGSRTFEQGQGILRIREDRLPAPLFGVRFPSGASIAVLDPAPNGSTTAEDSIDREGKILTDRRFAFGAVGAEPTFSGLACGFWYPGSEGEVTYQGTTYPDGHLRRWRRRFHPIADGFTQSYSVAFRFGRNEDFPRFYRNAWRWAWAELRPRVARHDIEQVRSSLLDMLAARVMEAPGGRLGIPNYIDAVTGSVSGRPGAAILGFTGKNLESAEFLLADAARGGPAAERKRRLVEGIFDSFTRLKIDPPEGEGFDLRTGAVALAIPVDKRVYLRSFGDDIKATLRAIQRERRLGRERKEWLAWCTRFGDWLLTQQQPEGGFPRSWEPGTGKVADNSPKSSYNAIPLLVLLAELTGDAKYRQAALRAGEFSWSGGQRGGVFVGGTIDNPDVIDKEAGTLSLEAYLALYESSRDARWLERARAAADFAETWIYLWNVPMCADDDDAKLHWKSGVPTAGLQLISTGHSLVDAYMAYDVDEFAKMGSMARNPHYLAVATLLLHNTNSMSALPGRAYDLAGPGWQQEHWSLAPKRGYGMHRGWLPWVSTSHLNGIFGLEEYDAALFKRIAAADGKD